MGRLFLDSLVPLLLSLAFLLFYGLEKIERAGKKDRPTTEVPFSSFKSSGPQNIGVANVDGKVSKGREISVVLDQ